MNYTEETALFACAGDTLLGILTKPETPADTGVIVLVGGPQYRVGSHRQFVLLSRALAAAGYAVLRFDYRGMGDSTGEPHTFENVNEDIAAAISALQMAAPTVQNVAFWGLCDGASAALLYCHATQDVRVKGLCLLNPWVRSEASLAKTQVKHYYTQRLRQKEFWLKLLSGKVAASAASGLARNIQTAFADAAAKPTGEGSLPYQTRMAQAWMQFEGPMLLILSGNDYTAKEFTEYVASNNAWQNITEVGNVQRLDIAQADHTFSGASDRATVEALTLDWLNEQHRS